MKVVELEFSKSSQVKSSFQTPQFCHFFWENLEIANSLTRTRCFLRTVRPKIVIFVKISVRGVEKFVFQKVFLEGFSLELNRGSQPDQSKNSKLKIHLVDLNSSFGKARKGTYCSKIHLERMWEVNIHLEIHLVNIVYSSTLSERAFIKAVLKVVVPNSSKESSAKKLGLSSSDPVQVEQSVHGSNGSVHRKLPLEL